MKGISEYHKYGEGNRYVYIIGGEEFVSSFLLSYPDAVFVSIKVEDWNSSLSPFRAENPFRKGDYFSGDADTLLSSIVNELIPMVESKEEKIERLQSKIAKAYNEGKVVETPETMFYVDDRAEKDRAELDKLNN